MAPTSRSSATAATATRSQPERRSSGFLVGLAVQRNYINVFVNATAGRAYLAERYAGRLGKVKVGKSSISFTSVHDVDLQQLSDLITEAKRLIT